MTRGDVEFRALTIALEDRMPPCTGDPRFVREPHELAPGEADALGLTICRGCPLKWACRAYGEAARPPAGVWAGRTYPPSQRRRREEARG